MELLASCWTTAGDAFPWPGRDVSPIDLAERITEANRAGFTGFGFCATDFAAFEDKSDYVSLRRTLVANDIRWTEVEFLTDWWMPEGPERSASNSVRERCLRAVEHLGASTIKVGSGMDATSDRPSERWYEELHRLSEEAAEHGACVAVEFLPWSNIPDLVSARKLVEAADHPNAKIMLDAWHVTRSSVPLEEIASLPAHLIAGIELNDGTVEQCGSDPYADTVDNRLIPGTGEFDLRGLIRAVRATGWNGPWGVEIISRRHRALPLSSSLPDVFDQTMMLLSRSWDCDP